MEDAVDRFLRSSTKQSQTTQSQKEDAVDRFLRIKAEKQAPATKQPKESGLQTIGRGLASVADTTIGAVGSLIGAPSYALAKAIQVPEEYAQHLVNLFPVDPIGRSLGITETPGYQNELSRVVMNKVGSGIEAVAEATGRPVNEVGNMVQSATFLLPKVPIVGKAATKTGELAVKGVDAVGSALGKTKSGAAAAQAIDNGFNAFVGKITTKRQNLPTAIGENVDQTGFKYQQPVVGSERATPVTEAFPATPEPTYIGKKLEALDNGVDAVSAKVGSAVNATKSAAVSAISPILGRERSAKLQQVIRDGSKVNGSIRVVAPEGEVPGYIQDLNGKYQREIDSVLSDKARSETAKQADVTKLSDEYQVELSKPTVLPTEFSSLPFVDQLKVAKDLGVPADIVRTVSQEYADAILADTTTPNFAAEKTSKELKLSKQLQEAHAEHFKGAQSTTRPSQRSEVEVQADIDKIRQAAINSADSPAVLANLREKLTGRKGVPGKEDILGLNEELAQVQKRAGTPHVPDEFRLKLTDKAGGNEAYFGVGSAPTDAVQQRITDATTLGIALSRGQALRNPNLLSEEDLSKKQPGGESLIELQNQQNAAIRGKLSSDFNEETAGNLIKDRIETMYKNYKKNIEKAYEAADKSDQAKLNIPQKAVQDVDTGNYYSTKTEQALAEIALVDNPVNRSILKSAQFNNVFIQQGDSLVMNPAATVADLSALKRRINDLTKHEPSTRNFLLGKVRRAIKEDIVEAVNKDNKNLDPNAREAIYKETAYGEADNRYENFQKRFVSDVDDFNNVIKGPMAEIIQSSAEGAKILNDLIHKSSTRDLLKFINETEGKTALSGNDKVLIKQLLRDGVLDSILRKVDSKAATGADGSPNVITKSSYNQFHREIEALDQTGRGGGNKLEIIFGKADAEMLRTMDKVYRDLTTHPPGTNINTSGTALAMQSLIKRVVSSPAALGLGSGAIGGPVTGIAVGAGSFAAKFIKEALADKALREQVQKLVKNDPASNKFINFTIEELKNPDLKPTQPTQP